MAAQDGRSGGTRVRELREFTHSARFFFCKPFGVTPGANASLTSRASRSFQPVIAKQGCVTDLMLHQGG